MTELFPTTPYDLPIPKLDGHKANKLAVTIGGTIELDRTNKDHLDFIDSLEMGRDITIHVAATVAGKGFAFKATDDDETTTYRVTLKAHTIR